MDAPREGHSAAFQQQRYVVRQNQQFQQQQQQNQQQKQQQQQIHRRQGQNQQSKPGQHHHHRQYQNQQQQTHQQIPHDYTSVGSYQSVDSTRSGASSQVDEGYRRIGLRLSLRAHGGEDPRFRGPPKKLSKIGRTDTSLFVPYQNAKYRNPAATTTIMTMRCGGGGEGDSSTSKSSMEPGSEDTNPASSGTTLGSTPVDRTSKVPRKQYSDHGDHHHHRTRPRAENVLRKMTIHVTELFDTWKSDSSRRGKKRISPKTKENRSSDNRNKSNDEESGHPKSSSETSPHGFAFSQIDLETTRAREAQHQQHHPRDSLPSTWAGGGGSIAQQERGLSAVIETSSSRASSQSNTPTSSLQNSSRSRADVSQASKSEASVLRSLSQGKCLTHPSERVWNMGLDNCEGNLIVHENDAISVSRSQIHVLSKEKMDVNRADFRIQSLLGQGTFAHVFQCVHVQTGNLVAIKIVKNKPAYTRQAAVEIDIFRALTQGNHSSEVAASTSSASGRSASSPNSEDKMEHMVDLVCYFMHQNHLCLVFELLGMNLYEVLKKRQFRGLPLSVVRIFVKQAVLSVKQLAKKNIVHCDLKPENILLISDDDADSVVSAGESRRSASKSVPSSADPLATMPTVEKFRLTPFSATMAQSPSNSQVTHGSTVTVGHSLAAKKIKLIDFGSACFEGQSAHTYIQSRFYRSPEVLLGLPYDSAIDMWSLGCVAAELFLGLPILPGIHEHDQLSRICEMISKPSDWMLDQGSNASKFFVKTLPSSRVSPPSAQDDQGNRVEPSSGSAKWRVRTQQEYIQTLSQSEIKKKGGLAKLEQQPAARFFKRRRLADIVVHKGQSGSPEDRDSLDLFVHFLYGILDPDPWKRWTAFQVAQHPFLTGGTFTRRSKQSTNPPLNKNENQANMLSDIYWDAPWDTNVCRRKLLSVQKTREKQQASRLGGRQSRSGTPQSSSGKSQGQVLHATAGLDVENSPRRSDQPQGLSRLMANPSGQVSASYTDYVPTGSRDFMGTDAGSIASVSQLTYASASFSYTDAGHSTGFLQNSLNEVDFAHALRRPGVLPMGGDSMSSSVDLSAASRSQHFVHEQHSFGGNHRNHLPSVMGSRSYTERGDGNTTRSSANSVGTAPSGLTQQFSTSMQLPPTLRQQAPTTINQPLIPPGSQYPVPGQESFGNQSVGPQTVVDPTSAGQLAQHDPLGLPNNLQQHQLTYDQQVCFQQQQLAIQQQQMMLQQQQAAIALQQQQLQAYGFATAAAAGGTPSMMGGGVIPGTTPMMLPNNTVGQQAATGLGMNPYGNGGYYVVAGADGTPMIVSATGLPYQYGGIDPRYYPDPSRYQHG